MAVTQTPSPSFWHPLLLEEQETNRWPLPTEKQEYGIGPHV